MGYVIRYSGEVGKGTTGGIRSRLAVLTAAFFLAFLLLTKVFWPAGTAMLGSILFPGDPEVTGRAMSALMDDLQSGQPLSDAVTAFCSEILSNADHPD